MADAQHFPSQPPATPAWSVVCLCAQWCATCRAYQVTFAALKEQHPQVRWAWVDIEDEEEVVGELDIDTFPTILIVQGSTARFLGAQPPQAAVLQRLLQSLQASAGAAAQVDAQAQALWQRLQPWLAQRDS